MPIMILRDGDCGKEYGEVTVDVALVNDWVSMVDVEDLEQALDRTVARVKAALRAEVELRRSVTPPREYPAGVEVPWTEGPAVIKS